jgi:hypothetical protein
MIDTVSLLSAAAVAVQTGDKLRLTFVNTSGGDIEVQLRALLLLTNGQIVQIFEQKDLGTTAAEQSLETQLSTGQLLNFSVQTTNSNVYSGDLYCAAQIQIGDVEIPANRLYLTAGYINSATGLTFPLQQPQGPAAAPTQIQQIGITDPAAGANYDVLSDLNIQQTLVGGTVEFTADANVANRTINLIISGNSGLISRSSDTTPITAGQTRIIQFWNGPNMPANTTAIHYIPLPDNVSGQNLEIQVTATNIQAGDTFSALQLLVIRYAATV